MAQAKVVSTTIRELMSRGQPPKSTSPVRRAHTELVAALAGNVPHAIYADVDSEDLDSRTNHPEQAFASLHVYVTSIIADTAPADALGVIRNVAEEMREHQNWRASWPSRLRPRVLPPNVLIAGASSAGPTPE